MPQNVPPPPPGFEVEQRPARRPRGMFGNGGPASPIPSPAPLPSPTPAPRGQRLRTAPVDGDTVRLNTRLYGVDAYERGQTVLLPDGTQVPIGRQPSDYMGRTVGPQTRVQFVGEQTYGRPVASLYNGEDDVAIEALRQGLAVVEPQYLQDDPERLRAYQAAESEARAAGRGGWSGQVARPSDFRRYNRLGMADAGGTTLPPQQVLTARPLGMWDRVTQAYDRATGGSGNGEMGSVQRWLVDAVDLNDSYDAALGRGNAAEREANRDEATRMRVRSDREYWQRQDEADPAWRSGDTWGESAANFVPNLARSAAGLLGDTAGNANPTYLIGGGATALRRMGTQALVNAGLDVGVQGNELRTGIIDEYSPLQTAAQFVAGGALQGGGELAAKGLRYLADGLGDWWNGRGASAAGADVAAGSRSAGEQQLRAEWEVPDDVTIEGVTPDGRPFGVYDDGALFAAPQVAGVGRAGDAQADVGARPVPEGVTVDGVMPDGSRFGRRADGSPWGEIIGDLDPAPADVPTADFDGLGDMSGAGVAPDGPPSALGGAMPPPPPGFRLEQTMDMAAEGMPSISGAPLGSPRVRDVIDINARPLRMDAPISEAQMRAASERISPADVIARPSNEIGSLAEFEAGTGSPYRPIPAPNERDELLPRSIRSANDASRIIPKRGPLDLVTWLRSKGGLQDSGGELRTMGLDNRSRSEDFAGGEHRIGKLVDPENGMTLDDAAYAAWEAGYFPDLPERPTVSEFLEAVRGTHSGYDRRFHPDDLAEVERYYQAQETRRNVVRARDEEGAPLVDDIGQPMTLADVEANTPPLSAFDDLPGGQPDFAGNIRLGNLDTPQNISRALSTSFDRVGGFDSATRGRVTQEETARLASELGMTPDSLLRRRKGQAFNAEEALAARQILAKSGNELVNMARRVQRLDNPGDELLADFQRAWVRHVAIQEQIAGATAEAGRALAQFRMMADSRNVRGDVLTAMVQSGGGPARLRDAADLILEGEARGTVNVDAARAIKPTFSDKLVELWYNSLLSGPQTHVVNVLSNAMTALGQIPEHLVAAGLGAGRRVATRAEVDRVLFSEVGARSVGLMSGFREGIGEFGRTLRTGEPSDAVTKVEARSQRAISGIKGEVLRVPTRLLAAEDELFKAMARRMELHGLAVRQARKEGLRGQEAKTRAADLIANPTDELLKQAFDYGRYLTFQRPLGPAGQAVSQFTQNLPIFKLVLPFVRTPTNLLKFTAERSPFAPLMREWRADFKAGGARRDLAVARSLIGTAAAFAFAEAAAGGLITGSPPSDRQRAAMMRANGWQPYSIRWGDQYYSYSRLDPFAMTIATAADFATRSEGMTDKQKDDAATRIVVGFMAQLGDKTWLSGVSDMVQALQDPDRYLDSFTKRLAGSLAVPTGVAQIARTMDPTARARDTTGEAIQARIPGLSDNLLPQRDVLGRVIENQGGVGPDIVSPIWQSTDRNDPVLDELLASRVTFDRPDRTVRGVRLPGPQYDAYQEATGRLAYPRLQSLIEPAEWDALDRDAKQEAVRDVMRGARAEARAEVLGGQPPRLDSATPPRRRGMFGNGGPSGAPAVPPPPPGFELVQ